VRIARGGRRRSRARRGRIEEQAYERLIWFPAGPDHREGDVMIRIRFAAGLLAAMAVASPAAGTPLDTLVAAERAFSALSVEKGMKEAFLANLAPDAVVFRPAPVNGVSVWRARTNPAATLIWTPDFAEISGDGDLGVTSGPWEFRPAPERDQPTAYGHFNTVWRRDQDGAWKVAADIGVSHEKSAIALDAVELSPGPEHPKPEPLPPDFGGLAYGGTAFGRGGVSMLGGGPGYVPLGDRLMAAAVTGMMTAERELAFVTRNHGAERAYAENAAADVRVFREHSPPMVGLAASAGVLAKRARRVEIVPDRHGMASSRDLGYSYGLLVSRATASARPDTVSYLHVWRRDGDAWKLALDVENEFAKRK
jgi:ketosteroid isomerase-like protein